MITKTYKYEDLYYGEKYSDYPAPVIAASLYKPGEETETKTLTFCIDTGADGLATIPSYILGSIGIETGDARVKDYGGTETRKTVYSIGVKIEDLNYDEIIEAVETSNSFGFLPRRVINNWDISLNPSKQEFTIHTDD